MAGFYNPCAILFSGKEDRVEKLLWEIDELSDWGNPRFNEDLKRAFVNGKPDYNYLTSLRNIYWPNYQFYKSIIKIIHLK